MNIWYISKYASPLKYGFASRHFYLSAEFVKKGHHTTVVTSDSNHLVKFPDFRDQYHYEQIDDALTVIIKTIRYSGAHSLKRILSWFDFEWKLLRWNKKDIPKPDVIIVSSLSLFTVLSGWFLSKRNKAKLVIEIRDIWPLTITELSDIGNYHPFVILLSLIEKFGYKKADVLVGTMPNLKEHVIEVLGYEKEVHCIPQGLDTQLFRNSEQLTEEYIQTYIPKDKFVVGYTGSIGKSNALHTLIDAALSLQEKGDIHFLIVGDGDFKAELKQKCIGATNITFAPKVRKKQVQVVLRYCDVLYDSVKHSRLYDFGLSRNKWIDYMYAGKPMIVSYKGYRSMLNEAGNGYYVQPEDENELIEKILLFYNMSGEDRSALGRRGKDWLLEYRTFDKLADKFLNIVNND